MPSELYKLAGKWCRLPTAGTCAAEFSLFRRKFTLNAPATARMLVSADSRYNLYFDGRFIGRGPVRGDLEHYHYETYEFQVDAGTHLLAVETLCWTDALQGPWSEIHYSAAFLLLGECGDVDISTPGDWLCLRDSSRSLRRWSDAWMNHSAIPAPQMEECEGSRSSGWRLAPFDDSTWTPPEPLQRPCFVDQCEADPPSRWKLTPSSIPQMLAEPVGVKEVLTALLATLTLNADGLLSGTVPEGRHVILLDLGGYYTHQLHFLADAGAGSCRIAYGESLLVDGERRSREAVRGGVIGNGGCSDLLRFNGLHLDFTPFWYRAGRFVELDFNLTRPLELHSLSFSFIAYPLKLVANFHAASKPELNGIFNTAWHTARCCAHEHYEDCPYWEQMQYVGDTRIQALISYIGAGDGRLGRQAIQQFDDSRIASGLTMSRYPSNFRQTIPEFSLFWILMIEDHYRYFGDKTVIADHAKGIHDILRWFAAHRDSTGLIGHVGHWNFSDWTREWKMGKSSRGGHLPETLLNLIYADTCRAAAWMLAETGIESSKYEAERLTTLKAVNEFCFSKEAELYTDVPGRPWFSQHVNAWAILACAAAQERHGRLADAILNDPSLSQCTLYFSFYLLEAMRRIGDAHGFFKLMKPWTEMLGYGFTTFPECPDLSTRSDCHAWSSGPFHQLLLFYSGIEPLKPGFAEISVAPRADCGDYKVTVPVGRGRILKIQSAEGRISIYCNENVILRLKMEREERLVALKKDASLVFESGHGGDL